MSLHAADLNGWEHLSPGSRACRRLVARAVGEAAALGLPAVDLWTAGQEAYSARLGREPLGPADCHGRPVVLMRLDTGVAAPGRR